jgi:hypothetical protein
VPQEREREEKDKGSVLSVCLVRRGIYEKRGKERKNTGFSSVHSSSSALASPLIVLLRPVNAPRIARGRED